MNIEAFVIGVLVVVMIAQNVFWAKHCLQLTNRIMSRNYFDVAQADRVKRTLSKISDEPETIFDPEDQRQALAINSMLGMV